MSIPRQDFLLQPYVYPGSSEVVWDFPLDDFYINGQIQPTPYGDSDNQHKLDIIVNSIGSIKQFPLLGFGLFQWLNSESQSDIIFSALSKNMNTDLYKVLQGAITPSNDGKFTIDYSMILPAY